MEGLRLIPADPHQKAVLTFYLRRLGCEGPVEFTRLTFGASEPSIKADVIACRLELPSSPEQPLFFFGSLGSEPPGRHRGHDHQFVGIFDWDSPQLLELVAGAYHFDHFVESLGEGHTFPLGDRSVLRQVGYAGALILLGGAYRPFEGGTPSLVDAPTSIFAVVPLSAEELALKRKVGLSALLDQWQRDQHDLFHVTPVRAA